MFGMIKFLQDLLDRLRRNKRVWFSTIFLISVIGILGSIFFLTAMTDSISKEIYKNQVSEYKTRYETFVHLKENSLKQMSIALLNDKELLELIKTDNNDTIKTKLDSINKNLLDNGLEKTTVAFKSKNDDNLKSTVLSSIETKNKIFGLEVFKEGVFYVYLVPVVAEEIVYGVLELRSSIDDILTSFSSLNQEFVFFLNKSMAIHMALDQRNEHYENFNDSLVFDKRIFNSTLTKELSTLSLEVYGEFLSEGYCLTEGYYAAHVDIEDTNGISLGMIVLGENKSKESGFINIIDKMKSQVILVALGLIVSILLFMF